MERLQDLQRQQIKARCDIARLYCELLELTPVSRSTVNAAHEWSLRHIESLVNDLIFNIPNQQPATNIYSEHFLLSGVNPNDLSNILEGLVETLHNHTELGVRIEQVGKGVA